MARGQKYNDDIKEKAYALLTTNNSVSYVAKKLNVPRSTVKTWKEQYDKKAKESGEDDIAKLRQKNKEKFVEKAWKLIDDSMAVAQRRIARELEFEDNVDIVAQALKKNAKKIEETAGVGWFELLNLINKLKALKNFKLVEISTLIGTIFDKQEVAGRGVADDDDALNRLVTAINNASRSES